MKSALSIVAGVSGVLILFVFAVLPLSSPWCNAGLALA
jgi:hypothetical protein